MKRVKMITHDNVTIFEAAINEFLKDHDEVIAIEYQLLKAVYGYLYSAMIIYME